MDEFQMDKSDIQTIIQQFYTNIWNNHDKSVIPNIIHQDFTFRGSLGQQKTGRDEFSEYVDFVHSALSDYRCDILDLLVDGPQGFARMRFSGKHKDEFFGYKPTGKNVEWYGAALFTFRANLIADLWVLGDVHGLLQMLDHNAQIV